MGKSGAIVRKIITSALCLAVLALSGCDTTKIATVGIRTDANGKHASTYIVKSSGHDEADQAAVYAASMNFRRQVKKPRKNHRYVMPVHVHHVPEPMMKNDEKTK